MATEPLSSLNKQKEAYQQKLSSSPTALGGKQSATTSDLNAQVRLRATKDKIQQQVDKQIQEKWFGPEGTGTIEQQGGQVSRKGVIGRFLDAVAAPLYGVTGAAEYALGKGTEKSLGENITGNISTGHRTMGDLLKRSAPNAPWIVTAPLGFALDVAFDPVNWATMGAAATIPRVLKPIATRSLWQEGAGAVGRASLQGLKTSLPGRIVTRAGGSLIRNTTGLGAKAPGLAAETAEKALGTASRFSKESVNRGLIESTEAYNKAVGRDIGEIVGKRGIPGTEYANSGYRLTIRDLVEKAAAKIPGGDNFLRTFDYNINRWVKQAQLKDSLERLIGTGDDMERAMQAYARGEDTRPIFEDMVQRARNAPGADDIPEINFDGRPIARKEIDTFLAHLNGAEKEKYAAMAKKLVDEADDATTVGKSPKAMVTADPVENAIRLAEMEHGWKAGEITRDDIRKIYGTAKETMGETGVKWYDNMTMKIRGLQHDVKFGKNKTKTIDYGNKVLNGYQGFISAFKFAKVVGSPGSWFNAVIGNPTMALMSGENVFSKGYRTEFAKALKFYRGKPGTSAFLHDLLMNADMQAFIQNNPTAFSRTVGISPKQLGARFVTEKAMMAGRDAGIVSPWADATQIEGEVKEALEELRKLATASNTEDLAQTAMKKTPAQPVGGLRMARELMKNRKMTPGELSTGYLANELFDQEETWFRNMADTIASRAEAPNATTGWKLLNLMTNKAMDGYETIDQVYKMTTVRNATLHGYTEAELVKMRNMIDLDATDLTKVAGEDGLIRYKLSPQKAFELANANYLNYNAMPAAVKMLRNMPLMGTPFIAFMYGMLHKTGNTIVHNPAIFNKMQFGINDFGGQQTPLEKEAINGKYYGFLQDPGMMRLPFFEENPRYLNVANMIPYYSFNMFTPAERRYSDLLPNALVSTIDKSPFLKDPVASVIFDYLILPHIISESAQPVGSFGQPLYPYGASAGEKSLYALRSLAETVVPGTVGIAGGMVTPDTVADYMPSYRWRQLAYAKYGKNQYGKSTKDSGLDRTFSALLSSMGVPVNKLNLTYTSEDVKKKAK